MSGAKSTLQKRISAALVVANLFVLTLYVGGWSYSSSKVSRIQDNKKVVEKHFALQTDPIEVIQPKIKTKAVKLGEAFEGESDWLEYVIFKVKNKSDKPITFFQIDLDFPETKATGSIMMHQIFAGQRPDFKSTLNNPPLYLKPGETMEISLKSEYNDIKKHIEMRHPSVENINKLVVRTGDVVFEDGTLYSVGSFFKRNPDPNNPRKWVKVTEEQAAP